MVTEAYLVKRIEMLQEELESLKRTVLKRGDEKKPVHIRGIWKGVDFSDDEIQEAKSSWLKD
jgi:hypothetical protein